MSMNNQPEQMKKNARKLSLLMGIMISLSLTIIGLYQAHSLTPGNIVFNFVISFSIMSIIGYFFNTGAISMKILNEHGIDPRSIKGRLLMALIIALINSPAMTFIMVTIAYFRLKSTGTDAPYLPMLLRSMAASTVCAFILCLIFTPLFEKLFMGKKEENDERN